MRDKHGDQYDDDDPIIESQARPVGETSGGTPLLSHTNDMPLALKRIGELEAKLAESEAQRAIMVAALEHSAAVHRRYVMLPGDECDAARQTCLDALATQPPSDLVALVKAAKMAADTRMTYGEHHNPDPVVARNAVIAGGIALVDLHDALEALLTNQPGFRALIESEASHE